MSKIIKYICDYAGCKDQATHNGVDGKDYCDQHDAVCSFCLGYGDEDQPCPECHKQMWRPA